MELVQREYLIHCEKWLAFYFYSFSFIFPTWFIPWFWQVVNPVEERAAPIFGQQCGAGLAEQGRARPDETCILRIFDGRVVWVPSLPAVCISSFFTEFVLEGVYIFWGSAAFVGWALLSLAPPSKKIAEKEVCATPKRATLKKALPQKNDAKCRSVTKINRS